MTPLNGSVTSAPSAPSRRFTWFAKLRPRFTFGPQRRSVMAYTYPRRRRYLALAAAALSGVGLAVAVAGGPPAAAAPAPDTPIYRNTSYSFAERAADLVSRM